MSDLEIFRSVLRYEMVLHKLRMKYDPPNEIDFEYTEQDIQKTAYSVMIFHRSMLRKDNDSKKDTLKQLRSLLKIKIEATREKHVV